MKEKILDRATELFLNLGFKSVTMDDLAAKMAISKKTIYSHFENKTQLVEETTMNLFWHISDGIDKICTLQKNPIEEIYEIKRFVMLHLKNEASSPEYQLQKYYPTVHQNLKQKQFVLMQTCIMDNVTRGMDLGIYRQNINPEFVVRIYFSGVTSIKDSILFPNTMFPMKELMDDYLEYHLRGIVTPEGRKILNTIINSNQE
ncbi:MULTISPECIES: TetR/AcrR family transcriptional regulator [Croceitalea]|uniref:TetR/AcrR family transcriptional regulator n=1 Tax=Croceitalea vernalis TaxID=3075599 RepID=A0ABU3BEZ4_9FLAO|nr:MULTISPECIES: TetR/AcrR family transcriptional regulator [unclassified Croceitalea]MDT0538929.1 TetR/AcrR family transcriptional regulator [Croceitalea sp. P059]MDT0620716.1 TetR/AcrR family transcriptional regulator [Croceitalea sp. P007]